MSRGRALAAALLAMQPLAAAGKTQMVEKILKYVGSDDTQCSGQSCCEHSTCWRLPGMGCNGARGETKCVGAALFPPRKGKCTCGAGSCSSDGVCHASELPQPFRKYSSGAAPVRSLGSSGDKRSAASSSAPDWATAGACAAVACVLGLALGGAVLGIRLRRRRASMAELCMLPMTEDPPHI